MSSEFKKISQKRKTFINQIVETYNVAVKAKTDQNQLNLLKVMCENLEEIYDEFKEKHNDIIGMLEDEDEFKIQDKIRFDTEDFYYKVKVIKSELLTPTTPANYVAISTQNSNNRNQGANVRLPKITIPIFDGNLHEWPTFYDLFSSLIHTNSDLNNIEKFQYLISFLNKEPLNLIKSIQKTDANYFIAFETLEKRYQNKRLLATTYWNSINNATNLKTNNSKQLRLLLDTFTENIAALKVLNFPVDEWCFILFNLLLQKLDASTRTSFEVKYSNIELPTYKHLSDFLDQHCKALESVQYVSTNNNDILQNKFQKPMHHFKPQFTQSPQYKSQHSFVTSTPLNQENTKHFPPKCKCCNNAQHLLSQCPTFIAKSPIDRFSYVKRNNLCINCLRPSHVLKDCISTFNCRVCKHRHHSLLHMNQPNEHNSPNLSLSQSIQTSGNKTPESTPISNNQPLSAMTSATYFNSTVLLSTAIVDILDSKGNYQQIRIVLDSASQANFITENCMNRLGLHRKNYTVPILGLNEASSSSKGLAQCVIKPVGEVEPQLSFEVLVLPKICSDIPSIKVQPLNWDHLINIPLADSNYTCPNQVDMLIGAEMYPFVLKSGRVLGETGQPSALETIFGWVLIGKIDNPHFGSPSISSYFTSVTPVEFDLKKFWELETISNKIHMSPEDQNCENLYKNTTYREKNGRFVVSLPFRHSEPDLGDTYSMAFRRFALLESRLIKNPSVYSLYKEFMNEYLEKGYMTPILKSETKTNSLCYLPHHCVLRPDKITTKLRVVFDGSAKGSKGYSLNETLLSGPKLQCDINYILLHFRFHPIVFVADIKHMYLQIKVMENQRDFQRILWRFDQTCPLQEYRLNCVTFGICSSPFLAIRTLKELAFLNQNKFPEAANILLHNTFVDDVIGGSDSVESSLALQKDLISLLNSGGFELRKWASNNPKLLNSLPDLHCQSPLSFDNEEPFSLKVLGLEWDPNLDKFSYSYHPSEKQCTKRNILSEIARLFDPLGFISPVTFLAKHLMQRLWISGIGWDDVPPTAIINLWTQFKSELHLLSQISIPRYIFSNRIQRCELHGFSDASELGYAAAVYLRIECTDGSFKSSLVMGKTKVAPIKTISIPRLELCGAVLLADLLAFVHGTYSKHIVIDQTFAYSDSQVVLSWLASSPHKWKSFVANRVSHVQEVIPDISWYHVISEENPVDCASRGLTPQRLLDHPLWFTGPQFLVLSSAQWNVSDRSPTIVDTSEEQKPIVLSTLIEPNEIDKLLNNISSFIKIQNIVAYCLRLIHNLRNKFNKFIGHLSPTELQNALMFLVKHVQKINFSELIHQIENNVLLPKPFRKLSPFLDGDGFVRVGGRLRNADISFEAKHPLLLPRTCRLTELLIEYIHKKHLHPGLSTVQYLLRQQFWILSCRRAVQQVLSRCLQCFRLKPNTYTPYMGDLPSFRISQLKAFAHTSVDYAGPFNITMGKYRGAKKLKAYICVFVCCATKAIHIELASDLSSEAFIAAFRRFVARRGTCTNLYSDRGTNFVGANNIFREYSSQAAERLSINWFFQPPASPHFNGLAESSVRSIKTHLYRVIGDQILTYEELYTLLSQIEALLNSRPLCSQSSDPNDLCPLTPGHFLTLEPLTSCPDPNVSQLKLNKLNRWQLIQRLNSDFWKRWHSEYLNTLQQRSKWLDKNSSDVKLNTLVLLKNELKSPLHWSLGRIVELHPGQDGHVRVVTVKTQQGLFRRPIVKLCPLPSFDSTN